MFGVPGELILMNQVLSQALPFPTPVYLWPSVLIIVFVVLNTLATDVFARVQTALSCTVLAFLLVTGVLALAGWGTAPLPAGQAAGWPAMSKDTIALGLVALAFWAFVGSEFVTPLVAEAKNPDRDLPRAVFGGLALISGHWRLWTRGADLVFDSRGAAEKIDAWSSLFWRSQDRDDEFR